MADSTTPSSPQTVELSQAFEHVEQTLSGVLASIQKLNEESQLAKEEIRACFGRQLGNLHSRETQLLRQVDVIYRARREVMQKQLAHCHRILGSLETSKKWTEEFQKYKCVVALDCSDFEGIKKWGVLNPLNWTLDEESLNKAIANFGKVDMDDVLMLPSEEESKCLPSRFEEYYEEDQQVLNKPLSSRIHIIDIKFPKLPSKDVGSVKPSLGGKLDSSYGPYRKGTYSYKPCDVQTWLGCIQTNTAAEPMEDATEVMPDMMNLSDTGSIGSKESDSIEIVSISNLCQKSLSDATGSGICPLGSNDVEIENIADSLGACFKNDNKNAWLLVTEQKDMSEIPISKACRANALCDTYESCVCDVNCSETAKKNRKEKERQNDNQKWLLHASNSLQQAPSSVPVLTNMFSDMDNKTCWLVASQTTAATNLPTSFAPFPNFFLDDDNKKWLHPASMQQVPLPSLTHVLPNLFADNDNSKWLRPSSPPPKKRLNSSAVFPEQFWDGDKCKWLHPESLKASFAQSKGPISPYPNLHLTRVEQIAHNETGSGFVDTSAAKMKDSNSMWLASSFDRTLTQALDEIKMKKCLVNQLKG